MNLNSMFMYSSLMLIPEVIKTEMNTNSVKTVYTLQCSNNTRAIVIDKVIKLFDIHNLNVSYDSSYKSSQGIIRTNSYEVVVKPIIKNNALSNEMRLVELYNYYKPLSIVFSSKDNEFVVCDITNISKRNIKTQRNKVTKKVNKEDICITTKTNTIPISIKMTGGQTFWETADGILNDYSCDIISNLILKYNITNFCSTKLTTDIIIDNNIDLLSCVYGQDILPHGCVIVSNFDDYKFLNGVLYIECDRIFNSSDILNDEIYSPVAVLMKCKNRNKNNPLIKDLVSKVTTKLRSKNAININDITKLSDFYDTTKDI